MTILMVARILPVFRMTSDTQLHARLPEPVERRSLGRFDWLISDAVRGASWLNRLGQPQQLLDPPAEPLKSKAAPGRSVVRVRVGEDAGVEVAAKWATPRGMVEALKWTWRGSPGLRAFQMARRLQALGFFTATPVAAGERRSWGVVRESFLLTRYLAGAAPLHLINARCADRPRRLGIIRGLAKLYAAMHDAGLCHYDPSQANFLVVPQPSGGEAVALIDLDGLRQRPEISPTSAAEDLRRLLLRGRIPRRERAWFLVVYSRSRKKAVEVRRLLKAIGPLPRQATFPHCALDERSLLEATASADVTDLAEGAGATVARAASGDQTHFLRLGGLSWLTRGSPLTPPVEDILVSPDRFLEQARVLKPSRSSAVSARDGVVLKRYNLRKWGNVFLDLFRGSRARRCFHKAYHLELCGIPTARPIAAADQRFWFLPVRSYYLMEEIRAAVPLGSWSGSRRAACRQVAGLLARLHREGFTHRDLKDGNIVFDGDGRPHLIDLDGVRFVRRVSDAQAAADLARLAQDAQGWHWRPSRSDLARFLVAYCRARKLPDWRWWWRVIEERLQG